MFTVLGNLVNFKDAMWQVVFNIVISFPLYYLGSFYVVMKSNRTLSVVTVIQYSRSIYLCIVVRVMYYYSVKVMNNKLSQNVWARVCHVFTLMFTAVLVLYLTFYLHFDEDTSTSLYHSFIVLCYATPLLGAIIADSLLGKFKSVLLCHVKPLLHIQLQAWDRVKVITLAKKYRPYTG